MSVLTCFGNPIGDLAVDPTSGTLIATHPRDCTISILDADDPAAASVHPLAFTVTGIAVSPDGARAFAARTGRPGSEVAAVDLATAEITSIPVTASGTSSIDVIRTGADGYLYASVCSHRDGELVVVDSARRRTVATIPVGAPVRDITLSPDGSEVYVVERDAIAVICAMRDLVFDRITLDAPPSCVATGSMMSRLYVADHVGDVTAVPAATPMLQAAAS